MGVLDDVKQVLKTVQQIDNLDLYRQILQAEVLELVEENRDLKSRLAELQEQVRIRGELMVRDDCYWRVGAGEAEDGPYCTNCWDVRGNLVRMWRSKADRSYSSCPNCKVSIKVARKQ